MQPIKISDNIRRIISDKEIEILNLRPIPYEMLKLNDFHYIGQILEFENVIHIKGMRRNVFWHIVRKLEYYISFLEKFVDPEFVDNDQFYGYVKLISAIFSVENVPDESIVYYNLVKAIDCLDEKEKSIISKRFGLKNGKEETLKSLTSDFNVSSQRIHQLEERILKKLEICNSKYHYYTEADFKFEIDYYNFSIRVRNALLNANIISESELRNVATSKELQLIRGIGKKGIEEIETKLNIK